MVTTKAVAGIIDNLRRVFQVVNGYSKKAERETGLTGPQLWAIKIISDTAPIKVSELARRMYLHPATVVGILDRLEARGLVARTRSTEDRRVVEVELTESGKTLLHHAPVVAQGHLVRGLQRLPEDQLLSIAASLDQLVKLLAAQEFQQKQAEAGDADVPLGLREDASEGAVN